MKRRIPIRALALCAAVVLSTAAGRSAAAPPSYDHIVIVVEENHGFGQVIGNAQAPYINGTLAAQGASLARMYAVTHPSQPNYLEFFSGANQGVTGDATSASAPFSTANLGAALLNAGKTFATYSEDLPAVGSLVDNANGPDGYWRKHNPASNWQAASPGANQLPATVNLPFAGYFPPGSDFTQLPTVSLVVPNQGDDMHNGTIATADAWLSTHIDPYYQWAKTHNSLLIVTWDEDDDANRNQIPTLLGGAGVQPGINNSTWTLHNLLRTVEDAYNLSHSGAAAQVRAIHGVFSSDAPSATVRFQQGTAGYLSAHDTHVRQDTPGTSFATTTPLVVDIDDNAAAGNQSVHALIRFDNITGNGPGQVPLGATVLSAKLLIPTGSSANDVSGNTVELHRMLADWTDSVTWNSLGGDGVTLGTDAQTAPEFALLANVNDAPVIFDVSATLQAWVNDPTANRGWALLPTGSDGWRWNSSEFATASLRPQLEVVYAVPEPASASVLIVAALLLLSRGSRGRGRHDAASRDVPRRGDSSHAGARPLTNAFFNRQSGGHPITQSPNVKSPNASRR